MKDNGVKEVFSILKELTEIGEVIAGSEAEKRIIQVIEDYLKEIHLDVQLEPINIMYWKPIEAEITIGEKTIIPTIQPYSPSIQVEGKLVYVGYGLRDEELNKIEPYNSIVLAKLHENPDYYETQYMNILEKNPLAIIFYDPWPSRRRILVATGSLDYRFKPGKPLQAPILHIKHEEGIELVKLSPSSIKAYVEVKTSVNHSAQGYNVLATLPGREEEYIILSAHHDHWFTGAIDNLIGVSIILYLAKTLSKKPHKTSIKIISFTAEESGAPGYTPWYWAYGSRKHVENLERLELLDKVIAVVNIDSIARKPLNINATGIEFQALIKSIADKLGVNYKLGFDHPYCDSYSFSIKGIPSVTFNTLNEIADIYHTDLDTVHEISKDLIKETVSLIEKLVEHITMKNTPYEAFGYLTYAYKLYEELKNRTPPSVHIHAYRLLQATRTAINKNMYKELHNTYKKLNKHIVKPVFRGTYEKDVGGFEITLLPELEIMEDVSKIKEARKLLEDKRIIDALKLLESIPRARIIPGIEEKINETNIREIAKLVEVKPELLSQAIKLLDEEKQALTTLVLKYYDEIALTLAKIVDELISKVVASKETE